MSAPITHIVLANSFLKNNSSFKSKKEFFVGTSFPDIRYLGVIERNKTHFFDTNLDEIKKVDSFEAGLLFHSLVDKVCNRYLQERGVYDLSSELEYRRAFKFFMDECLYEKIDNWGEITDMMKDILPEELGFGVDEGSLKKWHSLFQDYLSKKPTAKERFEMLKETGFSEETILDIEKNITTMKSNKKLKEIIEDLYNDFKNLIL